MAMQGGRRRKTRKGGESEKRHILEDKNKGKTASNKSTAVPGANLKGKNYEKTKTMRGGNGYGFVANSGSVINAGNIAWTPNMTSVPSGEPVVGSLNGGRRKSRKSRKSRNSRRKTMRGGGSIGVVGAAFTGTGERGIANYQPYAANVPPSGAFAIPTGTR